jgi:hypothetical protein
VRLLGGGSWGEVSLKKEKIAVTDVPEGDEEQVRFFLESVVQQANAVHVEPDEEEDPAEEPDGEDAGEDDADARMTSRFRDFGAGG